MSPRSADMVTQTLTVWRPGINTATVDLDTLDGFGKDPDLDELRHTLWDLDERSSRYGLTSTNCDTHCGTSTNDRRGMA
ncbi:MAG: hypothetical protein GY702_02135 [Desulfobulbaceae bacterium]|nr:hypothetical protein [Desulfobulbaceae bacterium]